MEQELAQAEQGLEEAGQHVAHDEQRLAVLAKELDNLQPLQLQHKDKETQAQAEIVKVEAAVIDWQTRWDAFTERSAELLRQEHVEQTRLQHLEDVLETAGQRMQSM